MTVKISPAKATEQIRRNAVKKKWPEYAWSRLTTKRLIASLRELRSEYRGLPPMYLRHREMGPIVVRQGPLTGQLVIRKE